MWFNSYLAVCRENFMEEQNTEKTERPSYSWMPAAGGALNLLSGAIGIIATAFLITVSVAFGDEIAGDVISSLGFWTIGLPLTIIWLVAIPMLVISILAIISGIFAINKRNWGLALTGAICSIIPSQIIGIIAVILIVISKKEFD
jgi:hypothetical protein